MKQCKVYKSGVFCGVLREDEEGYHFSYERDYLSSPSVLPLSPTMPLTDEEYEKEMMFPVFDGLIPEGWVLLFHPDFLAGPPVALPFISMMRASKCIMAETPPVCGTL